MPRSQITRQSLHEACSSVLGLCAGICCALYYLSSLPLAGHAEVCVLQGHHSAKKVLLKYIKGEIQKCTYAICKKCAGKCGISHVATWQSLTRFCRLCNRSLLEAVSAECGDACASIPLSCPSPRQYVEKKVRMCASYYAGVLQWKCL